MKAEKKIVTLSHIDLLRHGETTAGKCFLGVTDAPLTQHGWLQMQQAVEPQDYQRVVSSPLKRCAEFAQDFTQKNNLPLTFESDLREINFGDWDGQSSETIWQSDKEKLSAFWQDPLNNTPPNAEPYADFQQRVNAAFIKQLELCQEERLLFIVHGGVIRQIVSFILSLSVQSAQKIQFDYAGRTGINNYQGDLSLAYINKVNDLY